MAYNSRTGATGAISGATSGAAIGTNPALVAATGGNSLWAGPVIGGIAGATSGFFGSETPKNTLSDHDITVRRNEINAFNDRLQDYGNKYEQSVKDLYTTAYAFGTKNAMAEFASRGLQFNGGAFSSELARKATQATASMLPEVYKARIDNERYVDAARQSLFGNIATGSQQAGQLGYLADMENSRAFGSNLFNSANLIANNWSNKPGQPGQPGQPSFGSGAGFSNSNNKLDLYGYQPAGPAIPSDWRPR